MNEHYTPEELKAKTIAQQRAKIETYDALAEQGLPIPWDLKAEIEGQGLRRPNETP